MPNPYLGLFEHHRYKVFYGGRGSGKSWAVARAIIAICDFGKVRVLCCREIQNSIKDSSYQVLKDMAFRMHLENRFEFTEAKIRNIYTDSEIIFSGLLRNENSIRSKEGIDICWVEEASSVSQKSWDVLIPTIRKAGSEIWMTFNPLTIDDPTNRFIESPPDNAYVRKVNYTENPYFPKELQTEMEWDKAHDYEKYLHVWEGYPLTISDAQIFKGRYEVKPIAPELHKKASRLFYGADFGFARDPSTLIRCFILENTLYIDYESYGVGVELDELPQLYDAIPESRRWAIKADSARPETISFLRNRHGFNISAAKKWQGSIEDGIAYLKGFDRIIIDERCKHTADEFRLYSYKVDKTTDEVLPIIQDKNNHCIAEGELITTARGQIPIEQVTTADYVLTRKGFKKVLNSTITGRNKKVFAISSKYDTLKCTAEHLIFTVNKGFIQAKDIEIGDLLLCLKSNQSSMMERNGIDTQKQSAEVIGFISNALLPGEQSGCIDISGKKQTGLFRKGFTFTIRMATRLTMICQTLLVYPLQNTGMNTQIQKQLQNLGLSIWQRLGKRLLNGTEAPKGVSGIENRLNQSISASLIFLKNLASIAVRYLSKKHPMICFAQMPVNPHIAENRVLTISRKSANGVVKNSPLTNTQKLDFVVLPVEQKELQKLESPMVYDLTVDECHEFFVNGILVHNCIDAIRYALDGYITNPDNILWEKMAKL